MKYTTLSLPFTMLPELNPPLPHSLTTSSSSSSSSSFRPLSSSGHTKEKKEEEVSIQPPRRRRRRRHPSTTAATAAASAPRRGHFNLTVHKLSPSSVRIGWNHRGGRGEETKTTKNSRRAFREQYVDSEGNVADTASADQNLGFTTPRGGRQHSRQDDSSGSSSSSTYSIKVMSRGKEK